MATKLTARKIDALREPGMYGDGGGLYLRIGPTGSKSWILRTVVHGKRRSLGLGGADLVPLAEARTKAQTLRKVAREGGDPDTIRKRERLTFEDAARRVHAGLVPTFRSAKHAALWLSVLEAYAFPHFGARPLETIGTADVFKALNPIWTSKSDTARRVKQRIATVFDWAKGAGHYPHENPVNGLKKALPVVKRRAEHMDSMPWQEVPGFMADLGSREGLSARCLEFIILTAARSLEARGARWAEIDIKAKTWTVPPERMKRGIQHRVPLCPQALAMLEQVRGLDEDLVFPSPQRGRDGKAKPQSDMVFKALFLRMKRGGFTTHGFRSSFRDWASESAHAEREVAEAALSHATGNEVERAYARSDLFERRRKLMDAWGRFCAGEEGNVLSMVRG